MIYLGVVILVASTLIGYVLSNKYIERFNFFTDFNSFNDRLKSEVLFQKNSIPKILEREDNEKQFYKEFSNTFNNKDCKIKILTSDEMEFFINYVSTVGKGDSTSEIKFIDASSQFLLKKLEQVKQEKNKYRTLYIKLGFLIGLIIFIIII